MGSSAIEGVPAGGGGAPSGAAGGELAGTYPNPTVADGVIDDANIVAGGLTNAALAAAAGIANTKLATNPLARANHTGTQLMATISDAGTLATKSAVASADITDGTIVGGDLSGTIALPNGATATTQAAQDNSLKVATDVYVDRAVREYQEMKNRGFVAWGGNPHNVIAGVILVSQSLYVLRIPVYENISVTNICAIVTTAGSTLTTAQNIATLYNQAGTKQADTADQTTVWTTAGFYSMALAGGPYAITGGPTSYCWVSILSNGTTPAIFGRLGNTLNGINAGGTGLLTGANMYAARNGTAVTASATITPSSNTATGAIDIWIGLS